MIERNARVAVALAIMAIGLSVSVTVATGGSGGAVTITPDNIDNINVPSQGDVLTYDNSNAFAWVDNSAFGGGGGGSQIFDDITYDLGYPDSLIYKTLNIDLDVDSNCLIVATGGWPSEDFCLGEALLIVDDVEVNATALWWDSLTSNVAFSVTLQKAIFLEAGEHTIVFKGRYDSEYSYPPTLASYGISVLAVPT